MIDCEFDTLILSLVLIWIFYVFSFNLQLSEKYFYGYNPNNDAVADFPKVGVELKVTPFKVNKNNSISAKELLVLTILNYMKENLDDFYATHLWEKCTKILLLFYLA